MLLFGEIKNFCSALACFMTAFGLVNCFGAICSVWLIRMVLDLKMWQQSFLHSAYWLDHWKS